MLLVGFLHAILHASQRPLFSFLLEMCAFSKICTVSKMYFPLVDNLFFCHSLQVFSLLMFSLKLFIHLGQLHSNSPFCGGT